MFLKKFTLNKSCKLPILKFFRKRFKRIDDDTAKIFEKIEVRVPEKNNEKGKFKKNFRKRDNPVKMITKIITKVTNKFLKSTIKTTKLKLKKNNTNSKLDLVENGNNLNKLNKTNSPYFVFNYLNFFNFFFKKSKHKFLKNTLKKKVFFSYVLFDLVDYNEFYYYYNLKQFYNKVKKKIFLNFKKKYKIKLGFFKKNFFYDLNGLDFFKPFKNSLTLLLSGGLNKNFFLENFITEFSEFFKNIYLSDFILNFVNFFK
jgi:hypothetical protein